MQSSLFLAITLFAAMLAAQREEAPPPATRPNPHGPLSVPCENCHTVEGWRPLRMPLLFDHDRQTGFPLLQGHRRVDCGGCHRDLRFAHVPTSCVDCHADPHRAELGLSCERCHSPAGWDNRGRIVQIHMAALFPLTGAHLSADCTSCHRDAPNRYFGAPTRCVACHLDDYNRAVPNHRGSGFPTTCETCHNTSSFSGAGFPDHERIFPISTGPHAGVWSSCSDCHNSPGNFRVFTCVSCHAHRREEMDDEHDDVRGYRYDSNACLGCHPAGRE